MVIINEPHKHITN